MDGDFPFFSDIDHFHISYWTVVLHKI
jgi:hypothetical protein